MGLAPYGSPIYIDKLSMILKETPDFPYYELDESYISFTSRKIFTKKLVDLLGHEPRKSEENLKQFHLDLAASVQLVLEKRLKKIFKYVSSISDSRTALVYSGGVALNCKANRYIADYFTDFYIQPASGDAGGALGAAYYGLHKIDKRIGLGIHQSIDRKFSPFLGPEIIKDDAYNYLKRNNIEFTSFASSQELAERVAELLSFNLIGCIARGPMEFGPRALGNRSIICNPCDPDNQSKLNRYVKKREDFRPFAPCVMEEYFDEYFSGKKNQDMLLTAQAKGSKSTFTNQLTNNSYKLISSAYIEGPLPATTHLDLSARVQTVNSLSNNFLYKILNSYRLRTGIPVLINTSFNERGEPIVASKEDAVTCFFSVGLDFLVLGNCLIMKTENQSNSYVNAIRSFAPD